MERIAYSVTATLPDYERRDAYVHWLCDGHIRAVIDAGARTGEVVVLDEAEGVLQVEARYTFASREALERYLIERAPALRADGLRKFGPETGVTFSRRVGVIL